MKRNNFIYSFAMIIVLFVVIRSEATNSCSKIFLKDHNIIENWIQDVALKIEKVTHEEPQYAKEEIKDYLSKLNLHEIRNVKNLDSVLSQILLKFSRNFDSVGIKTLMSEKENAFQNWIVREIVRYGLIEFSQKYLKTQDFDKVTQLKVILKNILNNPITKILLTPIVLPKIKDVEINPEILNSIILNGFINSKIDYTKIYDKQFSVDLYNTAIRIINKLYFPLLFAIIVFNLDELRQEFENFKTQFFVQAIRKSTEEIQRETLSLELENQRLKLILEQLKSAN